jgi:hypothetical protein
MLSSFTTVVHRHVCRKFFANGMTSFRWRCCVTPTISANTGLVSRAIGGFNISSAKSDLSKTWGLGPQRADAVPLIATTMEPAKRLGSEAEGKAWLDSAAQVYAQRVGISLSSGGSGSSAGGLSCHEQREVPQVPG